MGGLPSGSVVKSLPAVPELQETHVRPPGGKILWSGTWQPTPVFFPGESHGQRSQEGCSPWGHRVGHDGSDLACTHIHLGLTHGVNPRAGGQQGVGPPLKPGVGGGNGMEPRRYLLIPASLLINGFFLIPSPYDRT